MKRENWVSVLLVILVIFCVAVLGTLLIKLLVGLVSAIWMAPIALGSFVVNLLNVLLNIIGVILPPLVTIYATLWLGKLIIKVSNELAELIKQTLDTIKKNSKSEGVNLAPIVIAGVVQILIIVIRENTIPSDEKVLLSIASWTTATILSLTTTQHKKSKLFGFVTLGIVIVLSLIFTSVRFNLFAPGQFQVVMTSIQTWFVNLSSVQYVSICLFFAFMILMIVTAIYYREKRTS